MYTRVQDILINIPFSFIGALNAAFVRSEQIDKLVDPKDPNYRLLNTLLNLMSISAMTPEIIYSVKRNTYLRELMNEIKGEDEKKEAVSISPVEVKHHRESRLARRRASAPLTSLDDRQFDKAESHLFSPGGRGVFSLEIEDTETKREVKSSAPLLRNIFTGGAILAMSLPVVVGHFLLFLDANEKILADKNGIKDIYDTAKYGIWPMVFCFASVSSGATLELLRGGLELAAGASRPRPMFLFANSHTEGAWYLPKNIFSNITIDIGANALVSLALFAEFALFMNEFKEKIIEKKFLGIDDHLLFLISVSLSMMSASMYLGHEGHMFLKIKKAAQKFLANEAPYRIRLIQHAQRFSQHARCEKNMIVLYQEEGTIVGRWRKGNTIYREPIQLGQFEERRINEYFSTMRGAVQDITKQEARGLVTHVAQMTGLTHHARQEYVLKELYFLGSILNATAHGVSRYVGLQKMGAPVWLAISMAGVSGLSRLATLSIDEEEFLDEHAEEHPDHAGRSLKYDARQRGKDVIYETCFIILIGLGSLGVPDEEASFMISHQMVVISCGVLAGAVSEITLVAAHHCHDKFMHQFNWINFTIDTILAPAAAVALTSWVFGDASGKDDKGHKHNFFSDAEWIPKSSPAVMATLILRHLLKKSYPFAYNGARQGGRFLYATFNQCRRGPYIVSDQEEPVRESKDYDRLDQLEEGSAGEKTALLSSASERVAQLETVESEVRGHRQRREKSYCEKVTDYFSSSWCCLFSRSPWVSPAQRNLSGSMPALRSSEQRVQRS